MIEFLKKDLIAIMHSPNYAKATSHLAKCLSLDIVEQQEIAHFYFYLTYETYGLCLYSKNIDAFDKLHIDFTNGALAYRLRKATLQKELIARAIGANGNQSLNILDVTAGLGKDSFLLSHLGSSVTLIERSPIIHALLEDALTRLKQTSCYPALPLTLLNGDSNTYLKTLTTEIFPDVIYLDPMYPLRKKTAKAKKEMQILQRLIGFDEQSEFLLENAFYKAKKRIVIKRPINFRAPVHLNFHHSIFGTHHRFDIYSPLIQA